MNLEDQISAVLNDPEAMSKISSIAASLGMGGQEKPEPGASGSPPSGMPSPLPSQGDDRTKLLMALKPFLSEKRAKYVDGAVTVMRIVQLGKLGGSLENIMSAFGGGTKE